MSLSLVPLRKRRAALQDVGEADFSDLNIRLANRDLEQGLVQDLGIQIGSNKEIPNISGNIPRIFVLGKDGNGLDTMKSFPEAGLQLGSPEFWKQVQLGNVFAYPAGKAQPVQIGIKCENGGRPEPAVSAPVDIDRMPKAPGRRMGFLRWTARILSFGLAYRRRAREARANNAAHKKIVKKLKEHAKIRAKTLDREKADFELAQKQMKEKARQDQLDRDLSLAQRKANAKKIGLRNHLSIFGPEPVRIPELETGGGNLGIYTLDQFKDLTVFTKNPPPPEAPKIGTDGKPEKPFTYEAFDMDAVRIGPDREPLTTEEFASAAIFAAMSKKVQVPAYLENNENAAAWKEGLVNAGFPADKVDEFFSKGVYIHGTLDNFDEKGRGNEGETWFKPVTERGRKLAADAFRSYQDGQSKPLAKIIAEGINHTGKSFGSFDNTSLAYNTFGVILAAKPLVELLEKDPNLMSLAIENGMDPNLLEATKGLIKINDLESDARQASLALAKARAEHREDELSAEEKAACAKKLIMAKLAIRQLKSHADAYREKVRKETEPMVAEFDKAFPGDYRRIEGLVRDVYTPPAPVTLDLAKPEGVKKLENIAEQIVRQENLAGKSADELYKDFSLDALSPKFKLADSAERAMQALGIGSKAPDPVVPAPRQPEQEIQIRRTQSELQIGSPSHNP